jgi:FG-GAP-like repeat
MNVRSSLAAFCLLALLLSGCERKPATGSSFSESTSPRAATSPEEIRAFCGGSCHPYPGADTFPRKHWRTEVERAYRFHELYGTDAKAPPIQDVIKYYEKDAPEELPPANIVRSKIPLSVGFEKVSYPAPTENGRPTISHVTLARLGKVGDAGPMQLLAADMGTGNILVLKPTDPKPAWKIIAKVPNPARLEVVDLDRDGIQDLLVANLGSFPPTDRLCGGVVWLRGQADGSYVSHAILEGVGRVADVRAADFRGTGRLDVMVAVFGLHATGEIIHLENETTDASKPVFRKTIIDRRHGAIHVPIADLNGDGKPDFLSVIAQEHEMIVGYINDGTGKFTPKTLYRAPHPGWGSSGIQLIDMNGDGRLDIVYSNGDILDEPYLWKPYHGIQWLENKGNLVFEHHPICAMYGAHSANAGDVFGTKRPAIAAVSFLPADKFTDREQRKADAVILLEQTAPGVFERHSISLGDCDYCNCFVGDVYGTGRNDIVVGHFSSKDSMNAVTVWRNTGPVAK